MYDRTGYYDRVGKFFAHGKDRDDLCILACFFRQQFTCVCRVKGSGRTGTGHPIEIFFSNAAKTVSCVINLNLHFVF